MANQKKVLDHCVNFNHIVNCDYLEDDVLTMKLIEYYQDFVFKIDESNDEHIHMIKNLDRAMHRYVEDYRFARSLKETLDVDAVVKNDFPYLEQLMRYIIEFLTEYEKESVQNVAETCWI